MNRQPTTETLAGTTVLPIDPKRPTAEAVAIQGGKIMAVGSRLYQRAAREGRLPLPVHAMPVASSNLLLPRFDGDPTCSGQGVAHVGSAKLFLSGGTAARCASPRGRPPLSIRPGLQADLVHLERNPLVIDAGEIGGINVSATWVAGHCVHRRSTAAGRV